MKHNYLVMLAFALLMGHGPLRAETHPQPWLEPYKNLADAVSIQATSPDAKTVFYKGTQALLSSQLTQKLTGTGSLTRPGTILTARALAQLSGIGDVLLPDGSTLSDHMGDWATGYAPDVSLYRITYRSRDVRGKPAKLSGLVVVPDGSVLGGDPDGVLLYMHATTAQRSNGPGDRSEEAYGAITAFASAKAVLAMPDYAGYGVNRGMHAYAMGKLNAPLGRSMIIAARELMQKLKRNVGQNIYITGYSEGGANALWVTRYLEENNDSALQPTRSAPMSGPYDLSGATAQSFVGPQPPVTWQENFEGKPSLLGFAGVATAQLTRQPLGNLLLSPLAEQATGLFPGLIADTAVDIRMLTTAINDLGYLNYTTFSPNPGNLLHPAFVNAIKQQDQTNPAIRLWAQNNNIDWSPKAPVLLLGIVQDELVPFAAASYPLPPAWSASKAVPAPYAAGNAQNVIAAMRQKGIGSDRVTWTAFSGAVESFASPVTLNHAAGFLPCSILAQAFLFNPAMPIPKLPDPAP